MHFDNIAAPPLQMHVRAHTHAHGESVEHCYGVSHGVTTWICDATLVQLQCVVGDGGHSMSKIFHGPNVAASTETPGHGKNPAR